MDMAIAAKASSAVIVVGLLAIATASGNDFSHLARTKLQIHSETVLSGVNFNNGKIKGVIQKLGKPRHTTISRSGELSQIAVVDGTYEWQTKNWRLRIIVQDELNSARITQVDVWGTHPGAEVGTTGSGLKLGDSIRDVRRIYRLRPYFGTFIPEDNNNSQPWASSPSGCEPTLAIDFDEDGKINHMSLTGFCGPSY